MIRESRESVRSSWTCRGLYTATWSPGDGITRYRFALAPFDYHETNGIHTALGWKAAVAFAEAFLLGQSHSKGASI